MARIKQNYLDYELRRWMRPDWRRFWKSGYENDPLYKEYERIERKFSPDQPRMPAGASEGGQWTSVSGAGGQSGSQGQPSKTTPQKVPAAPKTRIASRISPQRKAECEEQLRLDEFICRTVGTSSCWGQAYFRYSQCLIGGYVPRIYH